jgi:hypothetical protein
MPFPRPFAHWVSLSGVALELPPEWLDVTEYTFLPSGPGKPRLCWSEELLDAAGALAVLEAKRAQLSSLGLPEEDVSVVQAFSHPQWPTYGFTARLGHGEDQIDLCLFILVRPQSALMLSTRGPAALTAVLPALIASVAPWGVGYRLPEQRYAVFDVSFAWAGPLRRPAHYRFESPAWNAHLLALWAEGRAANHEPSWQELFTVEPGAVVQLVKRDLRVLQGGQLPTPFGSPPLKLIWEVAYWSATALGPTEQKQLVFCEAQAQLAGRTVKLQFRTSAPDEHLWVWNRMLDSVAVES